MAMLSSYSCAEDCSLVVHDPGMAVSNLDANGTGLLVTELLSFSDAIAHF
jgi:hypothetical protein